MNIYVVGVETSYDYRKFPWFKKNRGAVSLNLNIQTIVAANPEEAEFKYRESHNKIITWPGVMQWAVDGTLPVLCKELNMEHKLWIKELDKKKPFDMYLQYMTPEDLCLLQQCV